MMQQPPMGMPHGMPPPDDAPDGSGIASGMAQAMPPTSMHPMGLQASSMAPSGMPPAGMLPPEMTVPLGGQPPQPLAVAQAARRCASTAPHTARAKGIPQLSQPLVGGSLIPPPLLRPQAVVEHQAVADSSQQAPPPTDQGGPAWQARGMRCPGRGPSVTFAHPLLPSPSPQIHTHHLTVSLFRRGGRRGRHEFVASQVAIAHLGCPLGCLLGCRSGLSVDSKLDGPIRIHSIRHSILIRMPTASVHHRPSVSIYSFFHMHACAPPAAQPYIYRRALALERLQTQFCSSATSQRSSSRRASRCV